MTSPAIIWDVDGTLLDTAEHHFRAWEQWATTAGFPFTRQDFANTFGMRNPDAYERLLMDVVRGNQTLFMRRDEVEAAWRWIDPILDGWSGAEAPKPYTAGTWGPSAAIALIERSGRTWHEDGL